MPFCGDTCRHDRRTSRLSERDIEVTLETCHSASAWRPRPLIAAWRSSGHTRIRLRARADHAVIPSHEVRPVLPREMPPPEAESKINLTKGHSALITRPSIDQHRPTRFAFHGSLRRIPYPEPAASAMVQLRITQISCGDHRLLTGWFRNAPPTGSGSQACLVERRVRAGWHGDDRSALKHSGSESDSSDSWSTLRNGRPSQGAAEAGKSVKISLSGPRRSLCC
jgi:hypothetical protein